MYAQKTAACSLRATKTPSRGQTSISAARSACSSVWARSRRKPSTSCSRASRRFRGRSLSRRTARSRSRVTVLTLRSTLSRTARKSSRRRSFRAFPRNTDRAGSRRAARSIRFSSPSCTTRRKSTSTPRAPVCTSAATARTAMPHPCAKRLLPRWSSSPVGAAESRSSTRSAARARLPLKRP